MKMSKTVVTLLAVAFCSSGLVSSRIHQRADSIVIEVEPEAAGRKERYPSTVGKPWLPFLIPAWDADLLKKAMKYKYPHVPANTYLITEKPNECWMSDGTYGVCSSALSCNLQDKFHEARYPRSSTFPSRNTCRYVTNGKEETGVCCPRAPSHFGGMFAWPHPLFMFPLSVQDIPMTSLTAYWPWLAPLTTSTSSPSIGTSPWWVPDASSTTASPSSTTSPWWVPDNSTTTSPWWVPEPSSTTQKPSTWWVAESTSTTTSLPTTTSPWWTPEVTSTIASTTTPPAWTTGTPSTTTTSPSTTKPSTTSSWVAETSTTTTSRPTTTSPWWVPDASSTLKVPDVTSTHTVTEYSTVAMTTVSQSSGGSCGRGPFKLIDWPRIIGGTTSAKNAWPFTVSLMSNGRHFCGGSLLDELHILTAAHCVAPIPTEELTHVEVILGLHTLKPMDQQVVRRKLKRVVRHKAYNSANFYNDIAILKMDSPVEFSDTISPVCLPSFGTADLYVDKAAVVVGWGALQEDGKLLPTSLQQVTVQVQTNAECQKSYGTEAPGGILDNMLCAASPHKDSCMGDSGGPLVVQAAPGSPWIQVGIVSWGIVEDIKESVKGRSMDNSDVVKSQPADEPVFGRSRKFVPMLPSGTFLLSDSTCWTPDGRFGTCSSVRSCDPNVKVRPSQNDVDSVITSLRSTCYYSEPDGRQVSGVCCAIKQAPPFGMYGPPFGSFSGSFGFPANPWWPPYFPFGAPSFPAVGTGPSFTHSTTTSRPSTTSPWWVPDPTTTTSKPGTTSPWWVPDQWTTTSPASVTTSTASPSTTSPWWVPESTTSTTPKPSTTSTTSKPIVQPVVAAEAGTGSCGRGPKKTLSLDEQRRIVGGTTALRNSWPFIVALFSRGRHFCGGSLIDASHILTAAHCVAHMSSTDISRLEVALGMHTLKPYDTQALRKRVRRVVRHKGFDPVTLYNDVAILTLDSPVTFSDAISPVCLPPIGTTDQYVSKESTVVGWGALKEGGRQPESLQQVTVQIQSNAECKRNYGKDAPGGIVDHMICAAYPGRDSCSGDSGGPMVTQESPNSPWVQAGIVSWGIGCGKPPYPGVYSRVTSFLEWIKKNTE
ncbi:hypothetical protein GHT06_019204 [Daphnia sinensis]|uniref:Peptidase S1 domain-containing protein n=1 Tax=Daphnia sinensis TaxID=1820382 RepID=A0AAD5PQD5_9CRUS|nr:hypothetical protein GHT06_019204 [Daphnia sinensis]